MNERETFAQYRQEIGEKVKEKREEKNWDQAELATRSKVPTPFITGLENGEFSPGDKVRKMIGRALDFDLNAYIDELATSLGM